MEAESSSTEGTGDNASPETRKKGQEDDLDASGSQEGMKIDDGAHPYKKKRTEGPENVWEEPSQEEFSRYGLSDKNRAGFMVVFNGASASGPSGLS